MCSYYSHQNKYLNVWLIPATALNHKKIIIKKINKKPFVVPVSGYIFKQSNTVESPIQQIICAKKTVSNTNLLDIDT